MWLLVLMASTYGTIKLIDNNWRRYNENPTVIAIQKNYREWSVTFPAATFCFIDNLDVSRAKQFIFNQWKVQPNPEDEYEQDESLIFNSSEDIMGEDYSDINGNETITESSTKDGGESKFQYYLNFLRTLVNTTYENLDEFKIYEDDDTLNNLHVEDIIQKVMREYTQNSTFYTDDFNDREFFLTPTEMGMCYVHGGKLADYITLSNNPKIRHRLQIPLCSFNTLCYARTEGTPNDIRYYVHSPYEIPDISSPWFLVKGRMGRDVSFMALETTISPQINDLSPPQRKCRFAFEPIKPHMQVYSFNLCRMQCRKELAHKLCGCAPYFYTKEDGIPVCNIKGLACLSKHAELLITLREGASEKSSCFCLPLCSDTKYFVDKDVDYQWSFPAPFDIRFRWAIEKSNKIRIQRDVIFTFEDLVGSFGGIAALFLGCSVLSFIEIFYFFTLRLYWFLANNKLFGRH